MVFNSSYERDMVQFRLHEDIGSGKVAGFFELSDFNQDLKHLVQVGIGESSLDGI